MVFSLSSLSSLFSLSISLCLSLYILIHKFKCIINN